MELKVNPKIKALLPNPTDEELEMLEASLKADGCRDPLVVWTNGDNTLLDGHNRLRLCRKLKIEFATVGMEFASLEDALDWVIDNQLSRRNITPEKKRYLIGIQYRNRKKAHGGAHESKPEGIEKAADLVKPEENAEPEKTAEKIAAQENVSPASVQRAEKFADAIDIIGKQSPALKDALLNKEVKASDAEIKALSAMPEERIKAVGEKVSSGATSLKEAGVKPKKKAGTPVVSFKDVYETIGRIGKSIDALNKAFPGDKFARDIQGKLNECMKMLKDWKRAAPTTPAKATPAKKKKAAAASK